MVMTYETVMAALIMLSVMMLMMAIVADFFLYNTREEVKSERRSIVATGTMFGFYIVYFWFIRFGMGQIMVEKLTMRYFLLTLGTLMVVSGSVMNILGRFQLKRNWANHIRIYDDHQLMSTGLYKIVRHPLYASLILMFFGGSFAYRNLIGFLLTLAVFIPFMFYRARLEEEMLKKEFENYHDYMNVTGMFFPKLWR